MGIADRNALREAFAILEGKSFIGRITELTGEPLTAIMKRLPASVTREINNAVRLALSQAMDVALYKIGRSGIPEPPVLFQVASSVAGGVSGFFGLPALGAELPVTTILMLRSIAGIARRHGENLQHPATRLACLEVFALGPSAKHGLDGETSYYAARAFLAKAVSEATQSLVERGLAGSSGPVIVDLVSAVGSRFGIVVSEKVAAGSIPVVGAIGGASINLAFMQHFQLLAKAHFTVRRLERRYSREFIRERYRYYEETRKAVSEAGL